MHNNQPTQWRHQRGIGAHHATIEEEDNPEDGKNLFVQQKSNGSGTGDMILIFWNRIEKYESGTKVVYGTKGGQYKSIPVEAMHQMHNHQLIRVTDDRLLEWKI